MRPSRSTALDGRVHSTRRSGELSHDEALSPPFDQLPERIQQRARLAYQLFREDPHHASLRFKKIHATLPIFSVRVGLAYRALGVREGDDMIWFWVGSHADYDQLVSRLQHG